MPLAPDANITAWFKDAATRHPDILHTPEKPKFFEMEWELLMQHGANLSAKSWVLILEDYEEQFADPNADYISITPVIAFMVGRNVPKGNKAALQATYEEARRIGKSIIAKWKQDQLDACDADVPEGVTPPRLVDIHTLRIVRVQLPMFDEAFGVRVSIRIRTDEETTFSRDEVEWVPLVAPEPVFVCSGAGYGSFTALEGAILIATTDSGYVTIRNASTGVLTTAASGSELVVPSAGSYCMWASDADGAKTGNVTEMNDASGPLFTAFDVSGYSQLVFLILDSELSSFVPPIDGELMQLVLTNGGNTITSLDLSAQPKLDEVGITFAGTSVSFAGSLVLRTLAIVNPNLTSMVPPPNPSLQSAVVRGTALDRESVDALVMACDDTFISGTLHIDEGSVAGPSLAVADKLDALMASSWKISTN
jgi:hypothetical protein